MSTRLLTILTGGALICFLCLSGATATAQSEHQVKISQAPVEELPPVDPANYNVGKDRVAIGGYDPVAYFTANKAMRGKAENAAQYRGIIYHFASAENLDKFNKEPRKYLPAYGGWCAYNMAYGDKVKCEPEVFKITDGQLFLFYGGTLGDTLQSWNMDEKNLMQKADAAWKKIEAM